jgi:hypothetical protein
MSGVATVDESNFGEVKPSQHFQYFSKLIAERWNLKVILCILTDLKRRKLVDELFVISTFLKLAILWTKQRILPYSLSIRLIRLKLRRIFAATALWIGAHRMPSIRLDFEKRAWQLELKFQPCLTSVPWKLRENSLLEKVLVKFLLR